MSALGYLLYVAAIMAAVLGVAHRVTERRRLEGKKCPGCGTRLDRVESCVHEERRADYVVLPRVDLVRHVCPSCGRETRELRADPGVGYCQPLGLSIRRPAASPNVQVAAIKEIREWDRVVARLEEEHGAKLRVE